jgi:ketosteroid isomerase-like protein
MTEPVAPSVVQAFYQAYVSRSPVQIAALLDKDVEWLIAGPAELLPFCGLRRGAEAVADLFERVLPSTYDFRGFEPEHLLIEGDGAALFGKLSAFMKDSGRVISYHFAHFVRFRDGKVILFRSIIDSFDAAEQILDHPIEAPTAEAARPSADESLVAT